MIRGFNSTRDHKDASPNFQAQNGLPIAILPVVFSEECQKIRTISRCIDGEAAGLLIEIARHFLKNDDRSAKRFRLLLVVLSKEQ